ncbi:MAG: hypothetical protein HY899_04720 [Deltaproteobacteria bacterium]|nr:hypothetical protein [Deltaproteobacteria bacterium]
MKRLDRECGACARWMPTPAEALEQARYFVRMGDRLVARGAGGAEVVRDLGSGCFAEASVLYRLA